jgi:hypothetical protein
MLRPVKKTLATVAANSHAFARHASAGARRADAGSLDEVAEGGCESVESGGKAGIDDS